MLFWIIQGIWVALPFTLGLITWLFFVFISSNELNEHLEGNCCKLHFDKRSCRTLQYANCTVYIFSLKNEKLRYLFYSTSVDPRGEVVIAMICLSSSSSSSSIKIIWKSNYINNLCNMNNMNIIKFLVMITN